MRKRPVKEEVKDVLGNLISVGEENPYMTEDIMYRTCLQFFTDGYDTAAQSLSVLIHHLLFNKKFKKKFRMKLTQSLSIKEKVKNLMKKT